MLTGAYAHRRRLEVLQEIQNVEIEAGPNAFTVFFAADDFLYGGMGPDFSEVITLSGLGITKPDVHGGGMPFPAVGDLRLQLNEPLPGNEISLLR